MFKPKSATQSNVKNNEALVQILGQKLGTATQKLELSAAHFYFYIMWLLWDNSNPTDSIARCESFFEECSPEQLESTLTSGEIDPSNENDPYLKANNFIATEELSNLGFDFTEEQLKDPVVHMNYLFDKFQKVVESGKPLETEIQLPAATPAPKEAVTPSLKKPGAAAQGGTGIVIPDSKQPFPSKGSASDPGITLYLKDGIQNLPGAYKPGFLWTHLYTKGLTPKQIEALQATCKSKDLESGMPSFSAFIGKAAKLGPTEWIKLFDPITGDPQAKLLNPAGQKVYAATRMLGFNIYDGSQQLADLSKEKAKQTVVQTDNSVLCNLGKLFDDIVAGYGTEESERMIEIINRMSLRKGHVDGIIIQDFVGGYSALQTAVKYGLAAKNDPAAEQIVVPPIKTTTTKAV